MPVVALGCEAMLRRANKFRTQVLINPEADELLEMIELHQPDLLLVNPLICGTKLEGKLLQVAGKVRFVALLYFGMQNLLLTGFSASIPVNCTEEVLITLIDRQLDVTPDKNPQTSTLSPREENVVTLVAKGFTNKEIADKLSLSIHTVVTHRRNIAKKLQIHSPSGLTIYAITNNLVSIDETR